jgi:hypothetical protein
MLEEFWVMVCERVENDKENEGNGVQAFSPTVEGTLAGTLD